ncbi:hypothetical protein [Streptomyces luteogriseus]|uniref:hypothetical protein n=1 Tax=Streptomyces luteogriseus TaxID=68233 RepID=UPI0037A92A04
MRKRTILLATALPTGPLTSPPATTATAAPAADFEGSGRGDLATGVGFEDIGTTEDAGAARNTTGVPGTSEATDHFGSETLPADGTRDGHTESTITASFEDEGIGAATALSGSATGPVTDGARTFGPGSLGRPRSYGAFGADLIG